nr:MAG TPA: hypothetical protein [Caudoviricetes sp.]
MIEEQRNYSASIPSYPVEDGFNISDTIINEPLVLQLTLYVSNTPVTFLYRHKNTKNRVTKICEQIEKKWLSKQLTKIVTSDAIYKDMGITSISIKKSAEIGYAREISVTAKKVYKTSRKVSKIPKHILKAGKSMAKAGKASVSKTSARTSSEKVSSESVARNTNGGLGINNVFSNVLGNKKQSGPKKAQSILFGAAKGLKLFD